MTSNEKQGGLTGPGNPLVADAVVVDVNTPVGDVDVSASYQPSHGTTLFLSAVGLLVVAYLAVRA